jgi:YhcH/YjgK/YiaL family protein
MIVDQIQNASLYERLGDRIAAGLRALQTDALLCAEPGRIELLGSDLIALPQSYVTKPHDQGKWEAHRKYIDIQYMVEGAEVMGCAPVGALRVTEPYNEEKDFLLLAGDGDFFKVSAGMFAIFFPHDAHMPQLAAGTPAPVRKIVLKVRVE